MKEPPSCISAAGYDVLDHLGDGSVAEVWLVRDRKYGHVRALKVLNHPVGEDKAAAESFVRECALLLRIGNIGHPNIVWVNRPQVVEDRAMVEMQCVKGKTLTDYIHEDMHFVPYDEIVHFITDIGSALATLHVEGYKAMMQPGDEEKMTKAELIAHYGIAHNDLHSSNIMRRSFDGAYILLDFGLAIQDGVAVRKSLCNEGHPQYRPPEKYEAKIDGRLGDIRVDVYSFGILLFEMLAGDPPFDGDLVTGELYRMHKEAPVPEILPLRRACFERTHPGTEYQVDFPDWLENMVRKCLAKNPDDRYANMREFMVAFKNNLRMEQRIAGKQLDRLQKEKGDLLNEKDDLAKQKDDLAKQKEDLAKQKDDLAKENEALRATLEELEKKLSTPKPTPPPPDEEDDDEEIRVLWKGSESKEVDEEDEEDEDIVVLNAADFKKE